MSPAHVGAIVIGTEILRGKREDRHVAHLRTLAQARHYRLAYALIISDQTDIIREQLRWAFTRPEPLFCYGGLGATPDDLTRACAAEAAGLPLCRHVEAEALIRQRFGEAAEPVRLRMADLPKGATLIPNPVNQVPGFSLGKHHFFPGFPQMAGPMSAWVMEQSYPPLAEYLELRIRLPGGREGELAPLMERFVADYPALDFSSLPHLSEQGPELEIGIGGPAPLARAGMRDWQQRLAEMGVYFTDLP